VTRTGIALGWYLATRYPDSYADVLMLIKELSTMERVKLGFIEPMQVAPVRELPDGGAWTYEAKLDGYRCLTAMRGTHNRQ
jgi:ATP-dependent DNA ligase